MWQISRAEMRLEERVPISSSLPEQPAWLDAGDSGVSGVEITLSSKALGKSLSRKGDSSVVTVCHISKRT